MNFTWFPKTDNANSTPKIGTQLPEEVTFGTRICQYYYLNYFPHI